MTAEEFFRNKIKEEIEWEGAITLWKVPLNAEQAMRWANEYAKLRSKEELQDLLNSECHLEYLPEKIQQAIFYIDNPCGI